MSAIGSNSFGRIAPIAPVAAFGSNLCAEEFRQLLPWLLMGAISVEKIAPVDPMSAIGSNSCGDEFRQLLSWQQ